MRCQYGFKTPLSAIVQFARVVRSQQRIHTEEQNPSTRRKTKVSAPPRLREYFPETMPVPDVEEEPPALAHRNTATPESRHL